MGPGLQCEFGGAVLLALEVPEIDAEFCEIFAKHSIWSLVSGFGSGGSTQGTAKPESDAQWESARQQVEIFVKQSCGLASDAPSWVHSSIAKSKSVSGAQKNRGSLKSGNYVPTSSILPTLPSGWGSLTAIGEPCHTAEIKQRISRTVQVSSGSQSSAAVVEVIGPQWSHICDPWRKNGLPGISLVGCSSVLIDVSEECTSGVYAQGSSNFHLEFSPAVFGRLGIVHWPVSVDTDQQDDTLPLWSALHALIQGVNAQVLQRNGRLIAHCRSPVPIQLDAWCSNMCSVTKFDSSWISFCSQLARCVIRNSEHGPFLSLFLNLTPPLWCFQKYQVSAWSNMLVPENLNPVSCEFSMLSINLQGINRSTETPVTKCDPILALQAERMSDMIALQETYGAPKKGRRRYLDGFWSKRSTVVSVGKGLELWVRGAWASFVAVVLDEYFALLVLVRSALGLGIAGSLHMAQRSDTAEYHKQLLSVVRVIEESGVIWTALGADWNRDIRSHRQSSGVFEQHQLDVVSMGGSPMLPKDFFVVKGVGSALSGLWLSPIGDHPVVHVSCSVSLQRGAEGSAKRPVEAGKLKGAQIKLFTEVFEALSGAIRSPSLWMQAYRECLVVALRPGSQPQVRTSSGRYQLEAILQGQGWKRRESVARLESTAYWKSVISDWKQVSGPSLTDRSLSVLKLRRSNPFMVMHQIQCSATGSLVKGAAVLAVAPQECAEKYILTSDPTPVEWIKSMYQQRPVVALGAVWRLWMERTRSPHKCFSVEALLSIFSPLLKPHSWSRLLCAPFSQGYVSRQLTQVAQPSLFTVQAVATGTLWILHLTLFKSVGFDINVNSRPIKLMSAAYRLQAKLLSATMQMGTTPAHSCGRHFARYRGSSVHGLRRLVHLCMHQSLARFCSARVMFLDLVGAYNEISRGVLAAAASADSQEIADIVLPLLEQYSAFHTSVVTAQGLADPYHQLGRVLQGGGLDPLFYILGINVLHVAVLKRGAQDRTGQA